jgi:predicted ATPase/DNA-binding CsgD family transcriptional regulator
MNQPGKNANPLSKFTNQVTPLIGRDKEISEITGLLLDSDCRLLTIVGPGGAGKSRLALHVIDQIQPAFSDGVYFADLQPLASADLVAPIANTIGFPLHDPEDPEKQLLNYLQARELLILMDNFDHLLAASALLAQILTAAPAVKLLVTSREVLNIQEEWVYPIQGLPFPAGDPPGSAVKDLESYDAVRLFAVRARHQRPTFSLQEEGTQVARICQLVEGMPLAIELAASWVRMLSCHEIAHEIKNNLDFLVTKFRDLPARHRSMQATFEQSWKMLSEEERQVFKKLSVFRGGFQREAAQEITRASLPVLLALVDKSLLHWNAEGRYQFHELLRQYSAEKLTESPQDAESSRQAHALYFARFLHRRRYNIVGKNQLETLREIEPELENIRAAWQWSLAQHDVTAIRRIAYTYNQFCDFQGRYQEATLAFEKAIPILETMETDPKVSLTLALLKTLLGYFYIRLGRFDQARACFENSRSIQRGMDLPPYEGFATNPLNGLALLAAIQGDYSQALELGEQARKQNKAQGDQQNLMIALYVMTEAALASGDYAAAWQYAQDAHTQTKQTKNSWMMAYVLLQMGSVARAQGNYKQARQHYQAGYAIKESLRDPEGMAAALNQLGRVACLQKDYHEATQYFQKSLNIYKDINDRGGLATAIHGLADVALATGNQRTAYDYLHQALTIAQEMHWEPLALSILISIATNAQELLHPEQRVQLLTLVLNHPASNGEMKDQTGRILKGAQAELANNRFGEARRRGEHLELDTVITGLLLDLEVASQPNPASSRLAMQSVDHQVDPLVEPLTPRELEVLHLISNGMTNQEIAEELVIALGTVKSYTSQIYSKLNVNNRTQAVIRGREINLLV